MYACPAVLFLFLLCGAGTPGPAQAREGGDIATQEEPKVSEASAVPPPPAGPPRAARHSHAVAGPLGPREDEYYWLRDDTRKSPAVLAYLEAENAWLDAQMQEHRALQKRLLDELAARLRPDDSSPPVLDHGYWYYRRFAPGAEHPVFVRRKGSLDAPEEVLLDADALARGHDFYQATGFTVSPDGRLLAYAEDLVGRRQYTLRVKDLASGRMLEEDVANVESDFAWAADNRTLLYVEKDPVTLLSVRVRAHTLGTRADRLVYEEKDHSYYIGVGRSRSEKYLFIGCMSTDQSEWLYADAADPALAFRPVLPREAGHEYEVEHLGPDFIVRTNWKAKNFRIMRAPIATSADKSTWKDVLAHREDAFVDHFEVGSRQLAVNERSGGLLRIRLVDWQGGRQQVIDAPESSYSMHLVGTPDIDSPWIRYDYSSLVAPHRTVDFDPADGSRTVRKEQVIVGYEASRYETRLGWARARDGARIPVSVAWRKDTKLDGTAPVYQYAYGSYGYSSDPEMRSNWVSLLDRGFVVAIAHVRGGQEMGRDWYENGRLAHKMNTFTDFIDVTDWLVANRYGARDKVVAMGGSAGGLLMGAIANLAPERYRAIIAYVPFVDVVTTMLDDSIPLTTNEYDQWGNPNRAKDYETMLAYSPYDNVARKDYPAMLVFTGLWDSQVQYFEPAKWVARLRERRTDHEPLLLHVDMSAGHGGKAGRYEHLKDTSLEYAFLFGKLGLGD